MVQMQQNSVQGSPNTHMFIVFLHLAAKSAVRSKIAIFWRDTDKIKALPFL